MAMPEYDADKSGVLEFTECVQLALGFRIGFWLGFRVRGLDANAENCGVP